MASNKPYKFGKAISRPDLAKVEGRADVVEINKQSPQLSYRSNGKNHVAQVSITFLGSDVYLDGIKVTEEKDN